MNETSKNKNTSEHNAPVSSYSKTQRILAICGIVLLAFFVVMLLFTLVTGGSPEQLLFWLFGLIVIPCVLYAFTLYVKHTVKK